MSTRKRKADLCEICRKPCRSGHHYCSDHRDPRELPTGDEMLRWIEAQQCPLCADGRSFAMLANHTVKAHGITGDEIRIAAGLNSDARICSPEFTVEHRERMRDNTTGLANLQPSLGRNGGATRARMRAYKRLSDLHRQEFLRLYAEERAAQ
jgi:hypothetical protein